MSMRVLMIDGLNLIRRIHAAVPTHSDASQRADDVAKAVRRSTQRALESLNPTHALTAFDAEGETWRHTLMSSYKEDRPAMPADLTALLPRLEQELTANGIRCVRVTGFEADDVLATMAVKVAAHDGEAIILSTDKSMLSLLRQGVRVRNHFEDRELDAEYTKTRFGVEPWKIPDLLALVGERSQNIPGVRSVGAKTAAKLLRDYDNLEGILNAAPDIPGRLGEALRDGVADARLSLALTTLRTDVEVGVNLNSCRWRAT